MCFDDITNFNDAQSDRTETNELKLNLNQMERKPIELSEDKILDTKFTLSVQTMVGAEWDLAFLDWNVVYLQGEIEEQNNYQV